MIKHNELGWHSMRHEYLDLKENLRFPVIRLDKLWSCSSPDQHLSTDLCWFQRERGGVRQRTRWWCHPKVALWNEGDITAEELLVSPVHGTHTHAHTHTRKLQAKPTMERSDISELSWGSWRSLPVEGQMEDRRMTCRGWTMDELSSNEEEKRRPAESIMGCWITILADRKLWNAPLNVYRRRHCWFPRSWKTWDIKVSRLTPGGQKTVRQ